MDTFGQLTFADDNRIPALNEVYTLIETGDFAAAASLLDPLLTSDPDCQIYVEAFRTARYWQSRVDDISRKGEGIDRANFLMDEWAQFAEYAVQKKIDQAEAFRSVRTFIFHAAADNFIVAFHLNQAEKTGSLVNLGICFMTLGEFTRAVESFELARGSGRHDSKLLSLLAESYFQTGDIPKALLSFREAFANDPASIDLSIIHAKPVTDLIEMIKRSKPNIRDIREWIGIFGHITDVFYVKRHINTQQLESIKKEIYNLERSLSTLSGDQRDASSITPRLITKYLWLYDYYIFQNYNFENASQIRERLLEIDQPLLFDYFKKEKR